MDRRTGQRKVTEDEPVLGLIRTGSHEVLAAVEHPGGGDSAKAKGPRQTIGRRSPNANKKRYDGAAELDRFLDLLLPGLTATLTGRDGQPATV